MGANATLHRDLLARRAGNKARDSLPPTQITAPALGHVWKGETRLYWACSSSSAERMLILGTLSPETSGTSERVWAGKPMPLAPMPLEQRSRVAAASQL